MTSGRSGICFSSSLLTQDLHRVEFFVNMHRGEEEWSRTEKKDLESRSVELEIEHKLCYSLGSEDHVLKT